MTKVSVIIPVLNEEERLTPFLQSLTHHLDDQCEIIGVDGGSTDDSFKILQNFCDKSLQSPPGRSTQMNTGAGEASGNILLFLHADTTLPPNGLQAIRTALSSNDWGRFDVRFDTQHPSMNTIAFFINLRSRLTKVATGDQALFFRAAFFEDINQYPEIPLMEDIAISKTARKTGSYSARKEKVTTSARKWEKHGIIKTTLLMWQLRLQYVLGTPPEKLARKYYG